MTFVDGLTDVIYLDYHATTPVDPAVLDGDAAVLHRAVRQRREPAASARVGRATKRSSRRAGAVAALIGADAKEIVFTSGATEANNLALKGLAEVRPAERDHFVTVVTEHKSVLDTCKRLERHGCQHDGAAGRIGRRRSISTRCARR